MFEKNWVGNRFGDVIGGRGVCGLIVTVGCKV